MEDIEFLEKKIRVWCTKHAHLHLLIQHWKRAPHYLHYLDFKDQWVLVSEVITTEKSLQDIYLPVYKSLLLGDSIPAGRNFCLNALWHNFPPLLFCKEFRSNHTYIICTHAAASHVHYGNSHVINCGATWINYIHYEPLTAPLALCPLIHLCWHVFDTVNLQAVSSSHCLKTNGTPVPHIILSYWFFFLNLEVQFLPLNSDSCDLALNNI